MPPRFGSVKKLVVPGFGSVRSGCFFCGSLNDEEEEEEEVVVSDVWSLGSMKELVYMSSSSRDFEGACSYLF